MFAARSDRRRERRTPLAESVVARDAIGGGLWSEYRVQSSAESARIAPDAGVGSPVFSLWAGGYGGRRGGKRSNGVV